MKLLCQKHPPLMINSDFCQISEIVSELKAQSFIYYQKSFRDVIYSYLYLAEFWVTGAVCTIVRKRSPGVDPAVWFRHQATQSRRYKHEVRRDRVTYRQSFSYAVKSNLKMSDVRSYRSDDLIARNGTRGGFCIRDIGIYTRSAQYLRDVSRTSIT